MAIFCVRNDDVNILDDELQSVTAVCVEEGVPITHAVEPANVTPETVSWLREQKRQHGRLIEIMQHGWDHRRRDRGEFGGVRPYAEQYADLERGRDRLREAFGDHFLPCLNFPFGPYNRHSIRAADELGFRVLNSHYNRKLSRRVFYAVGHLLRRGLLLGRHVSWHLADYPGTGMFCIDMSLSVIARYHGAYGDRTCDFHTVEELAAQALAYRRLIPVVGIVLHHRYHTTPASLELIRQTLHAIRDQGTTEFRSLGEVYHRFGRNPGEGFRGLD